MQLHFKVLRVYDTRFRASERRPTLYLDPKCKGIVGGVAKKVLEIPEPFAPPEGKASSQDGDPHWIMNFYKELPGKWLFVIATTFRAGQHAAQRPKDFLPIIEHLESIHKAGYVHGDVRACNAAFPKEEGDQGYLIDFDFSGKAGDVTYPVGYVRNLDDGDRKGSGKEKVEKWHDWYALGRLIFDVHKIVPPTEENFTWDYLTCYRYWMDVKTHPSAEQICELKALLSKLDDEGWRVEASDKLRKSVNPTGTKNDRRTKEGASGSITKSHLTFSQLIDVLPFDGIGKIKHL